MATLKPRDGKGLPKVIQGVGSKSGSAEALPTAHCPKLPRGGGLGSLVWVFPWMLEISAQLPFPCGVEAIGVQRSQHRSKYVGGISPFPGTVSMKHILETGYFFFLLKVSGD